MVENRKFHTQIFYQEAKWCYLIGSLIDHVKFHMNIANCPWKFFQFPLHQNAVHLTAKYTFSKLLSSKSNKVLKRLSPECSAKVTGLCFICKWELAYWDLLRTSIAAWTIHKNTLSAPFGIFYVQKEIWKQIFQKKSYTTP